MNYLVNFENLPWVELTSGMRCKTFTNNNKIIRLIELSEGFIDHDWCLKAHTNYILEGEFTTDFNGEKIKFKQGDVIYIPDGKEHKAILNKGEKVLMLDF